MQFPVCRRPYPGELFYGYLRSLYSMNGIDNMRVLHQYLSSNGIDSISMNVIIPTGLSKICDIIENKTFPTLEEIIDMTVFYGMIHGLKDGQISKLAETMLYPTSNIVPRAIEKMTDVVVKICPICWKEDYEEYGEGYFHVAHHLQNVTVCYKHHVALREIVLSKRRNMLKPLAPKYGQEISINDMQASIEQAMLSVKMMQQERKRKLLQKYQCQKCGKEYLLTQWSKNTGAPCPYCSEYENSKDIIQRRLDIKYPGQYKVLSNSSFSRTKIMHLPCEQISQKLGNLLYNENPRCQKCNKLTPEGLYYKYSSKDWIFYDNPVSERRKKRIHVKHKVCNNDFSIFMPQFSSKKDGYCPYCDKRQEPINISDVDREYEIVSSYQNNHEMIDIRHIRCRCIFRTSKTNFLAGARCPICVPRYSYQDVVDAVADCTEGYIVEKAEKRGHVNIIHGSDIYKRISYQKVMIDLKRDVPEIFQFRHTVYRDKRSIRKLIYDNVCSESLKKGFWSYADGLDGNEVSLDQKRIVQSMARVGYIHRIDAGKYNMVRRDGKL